MARYFFVLTAGNSRLPPVIWSVPMAPIHWCAVTCIRSIKFVNMSLFSNGLRSNIRSRFIPVFFDNDATDCYSWSISKDGYFIFGGAYPMKDGQQRFDALKQKMADFHFRFGAPVKSEKCTVLFPSRWADFVCGKENAFLIGEAAGFISASSLEGISYALDSAELLNNVLKQNAADLNAAWWRATRKLRLKLYSKIIKSRCLTAPGVRKLIMHSNIAHIPLNNSLG